MAGGVFVRFLVIGEDESVFVEEELSKAAEESPKYTSEDEGDKNSLVLLLLLLFASPTDSFSFSFSFSFICFFFKRVAFLFTSFIKGKKHAAF